MASRHLVLFDIDGTLLRCGPQVRPLFFGALQQVFGQPGDGELDRDLSGYSFAGKTDPMITRDLMRYAGLKDGQIMPRLAQVREVYTRRLQRGLARERMQLLPGVVSLLERLAARTDVVLGLLTGNWRRGAEIKLSRFDLNRFFSFGAFGDDALERRELLPIAVRRASEVTGHEFLPDQTLIVGDTPLDVDCARAGGVPSLAVATGFTSEADLRVAGADWVFRDLDRAGREFALFL